MSELKPCPICHEQEQKNDYGRVFYKELPHIENVITTLDDEHVQLVSDKNGWALHFEDDYGDRMFDVKAEFCPVCGRNLYNRRYQEPNEPLTLEQLREMDGEPVWIQGDSAKVSGWTLFKSSTEKQIARCPDEWNISYYLKDYGKTWLAYRRKTESEETE